MVGEDEGERVEGEGRESGGTEDEERGWRERIGRGWGARTGRGKDMAERGWKREEE